MGLTSWKNNINGFNFGSKYVFISWGEFDVNT